MELALITRLENWLAANRHDYLAQLQPGVTDRQLSAFEERFSVKLPEVFRSLYKWRNGQPNAFTAPLQYNQMFTPLEDIAETKHLLDGMIGSDFEDPRWWRRGWVPFLENYGGDHLCLDLTAEDGGCPGQVISFWHDWEGRSIKYASFEEWLSQLVQSMEEGTLELSE
jgi:cell wall assembly regulator SMI1